jgi:hypothetical protein
MRKNFFVIFILIFLVSCGEKNKTDDALNYIAENESIELQAAEIFLNGELVLLMGNFNGQWRFRMRDIENLLSSTQSRFNYETQPAFEWNADNRTITEAGVEYRIHRFRVSPPNASDLTEPEASLQNAVVVPEFTRLYTPFEYRDGAVTYVNTLKINGYNYFTLCSLAAVLGFTTEYNEDFSISINTNEANISEYGWQAAKNFLSQFPTLFFPHEKWSDELLADAPFILPWGHFNEDEKYSRFYPISYTLYDFNNNGIPDILIQYDTPGRASYSFWHLFVCADGSYQEITTISLWGGIFSDTSGRIFTVEGSHQEGFTHSQMISFENENPAAEIFLWTCNWNRMWEVEAVEELCICEINLCYEQIWSNWNFFAPTIPGVPDEPMIAVRHIPSEKLFAEEFELCECGTNYVYELRRQTPPLNVRSLHEADDFSNEFENIHAFTYLQWESEWPSTIIIWSDEPLYDFSFVSLDNNAAMYFYVREILFTVDELLPTDAVALTVAFEHYLHPRGGIMFTDANGVKKSAFIYESMEGGCVPLLHVSFPREHGFYFTETVEPWQTAYVELLQDYIARGFDLAFRLFDIDKDGIPEIILSAFPPEDYHDEGIHAVYTFRDGEIISLEEGEMRIIDFIRSTRFWIRDAADNFPALIGRYNGPTAGRFGADRILYWRIVIDGDKLIADTLGEWFLDLDMLTEMFGLFGGDTPDDVLDAAMREHTHFHIDDTAVTEEEFFRVFGSGQRYICGLPVFCAETYIDAILNWPPAPAITEGRTVTMRVHESLPEFTFRHTIKNYESTGIYDYWGDDYIHITITDEYGNLIQELEGVNVHRGFIGSVAEFGDYNFDGYLDMRLQQFNNGVSFSWDAHYYWLWDTEISQFVPSERLMEISDIAILNDIFPESRQLCFLVNKAFGGGFLKFRIYEYINGDYVPIEEIEAERFGQMEISIRTNLTTDEATVSINNMNEPLSDEETAKIISEIKERISWTDTQTKTSKEWNGAPWIHTHLQKLTYDGNINFTDYFYNGELVYRTGSLESHPQVDGGISFHWYYNDNGELIFAEVHQYRYPTYFIYFHNDAVIRLILGEHEHATEFDDLMINAIALSFENAYR